jgi:hypothetical protein
MRMRLAFERIANLLEFGDDLADAPFRKSLINGHLVIAPTFAKSLQDALRPRRPTEFRRLPLVLAPRIPSTAHLFARDNVQASEQDCCGDPNAHKRPALLHAGEPAVADDICT